MTELNKDTLDKITRLAASAQPQIDHFGKQLAPETSQAGIAFINMLSLIRIADALEKIAANPAGGVQSAPAVQTSNTSVDEVAVG